MAFKFESLEVWQLSLDYIDLIYEIAKQLPANEERNLSSQIRRAATSVSLNIAEGSQGQSDPEQARFLSISLRSLIETVACLKIIERRKFVVEPELIQKAYVLAELLGRKLQSFRNSVNPKKR